MKKPSRTTTKTEKVIVQQNAPKVGRSQAKRENVPSQTRKNPLSEKVGNEINAKLRSLPEPNVFVYHDHIFTDSLAVSEYFGKRHDNVVQTIERLDCSDEFNALNFQAVKYKDKKGEMRKAYRITRDGFVFLVMGFTGKKAAMFKEAYIKRFNEMEKWLFLRVENKQIQDFFADAVKEYEDRQPPKYRRPHAYAIENNLIYIVALGATKKKWLAQQGLPPDCEIRNHLSYAQLQRVDAIVNEAMQLLKRGFLYADRKLKLNAFAKSI